MRRVATALLVVLLATGCARARYASSYPDQLAAVRRDAVDRAWVPAFLPDDTTDVREAHDPAAGTHVVAATLPDDTLPAACVEAPEGPADPAGPTEPDEGGTTTTPTEGATATTDLAAPALEAGFVDEALLRSGTRITCEDGWVGAIGGDAVLLWATDPTPPEDE